MGEGWLEISVQIYINDAKLIQLVELFKYLARFILSNSNSYNMKKK